MAGITVASLSRSALQLGTSASQQDNAHTPSWLLSHPTSRDEHSPIKIYLDGNCIILQRNYHICNFRTYWND